MHWFIVQTSVSPKVLDKTTRSLKHWYQEMPAGKLDTLPCHQKEQG